MLGEVDAGAVAGAGGAGAGDVPQTFLASYTWPPATLTGALSVATLPAYTQTGAVVTLPPPTFTSGSGSAAKTVFASVGDGWANASDSALLFVPVSTCGYLDPWMGPPASTAACPPLQRRDYAPRAGATPAPRPSR